MCCDRWRFAASTLLAPWPTARAVNQALKLVRHRTVTLNPAYVCHGRRFSLPRPRIEITVQFLSPVNSYSTFALIHSVVHAIT